MLTACPHRSTCRTRYLDCERVRASVLAKMRERKAQDLSDAELDRVFIDTVSPIACKRVVRQCVRERDLWEPTACISVLNRCSGI